MFKPNQNTAPAACLSSCSPALFWTNNSTSHYFGAVFKTRQPSHPHTHLTKQSVLAVAAVSLVSPVQTAGRGFQLLVATIHLTSACSSREDRKVEPVCNYKAMRRPRQQETWGVSSKHCMGARLKGLRMSKMFVFMNMHVCVYERVCVLQTIMLKARN